MSKPELTRVVGSLDHKIHKSFIDDAQKEALEGFGFKFDKSYVEDTVYYRITIDKMPERGFEGIFQEIMQDPEMPASLTFRYAYTNPAKTASGYGGGMCRITKKAVDWADSDAIPAMVDAVKFASKESSLSERTKKALAKANEKIGYPEHLAESSAPVTIMGVPLRLGATTSAASPFPSAA